VLSKEDGILKFPMKELCSLRSWSNRLRAAFRSLLLCSLIAMILLERPAFAAPPATFRPIDFERDVRPILAKRCFECHGAETQESQLRLDDRSAVLKGGKSGRPAAVPGQSTASRLVVVITGRDAKVVMPPDGARLTNAEIAILRRWIDEGLRWGVDPANPPVQPTQSEQNRADFWSFKPIHRRRVPLPESDGADANPIDAFVANKLASVGLSSSPPADRRTLVRRLCLDALGLPPAPETIAKFAGDTDPLAWQRLVDRVLASPHFGERWARHWLDVVRFAETDGFETNIERPNAFRYRDYLIRALNDDTPYDRFVCEQIAGDGSGAGAATGFLVGGPCDKVKSPDLVLTRMQRQDELTDMVNTTGTAFLGLTLGCAKCHNHKFDPIPQHDFYAIQAVFAGVRHGDRTLNADARRDHAEIRPISAYAGQFDQPEPVHRLHRGDPMAPRETVEPGAVSVLGLLKIPPRSLEHMRRAALAAWIVRPENPLTARVIVNRVWHYHFGHGLVETPSDFGHNGGRPSHPELLDWLAGELICGHWSLKHIHRLILTSNTYRQSSAPRADGLQKDAQARWLWRFPPRRLEAEAIRDSILAASGALDCRMEGPGFSAFKPNTNYVRVYLPKEDFGPSEWRRMVYMTKVRMEHDAVFGAFDCPDAGLIAPRRMQSTTPLQALNLMNSRFTIQQAHLLASRAQRDAGAALADQVTRTFELTLGRRPDPAEAVGARRLAESHGLASLCRSLFNANEFLFLP
jgi:hypothetical protein